MEHSTDGGEIYQFSKANETGKFLFVVAIVGVLAVLAYAI